MIRSVTLVPGTGKDSWKRCLNWCFGLGLNLSARVSQAPAQSYSKAPDHLVGGATLTNQRLVSASETEFDDFERDGSLCVTTGRLIWIGSGICQPQQCLSAN